MTSRMQINTGGLSFSQVRENGKYYVDKTLLIKDILDQDDRGVYLFTRPRRFGKTTNLSMLDAFFNIEYRGNTWFDGLAISGYPEYERYRNAYPVIHLDLKDAASPTFDDFLDAVNTSVIDAMAPFTDMLETGSLGRADSVAYERICTRSASREELKSSLRMLSRVVSKLYGSRAVILIDEYDRAVTNAFGTECQRPVIDFLGGLMSSALKSNGDLQMAYVTGVMQIAKAGMFSGLNNLTEYSVFTERSDERFGFTESEVGAILDYYGHPEKMDEVRRWYDGYRFGDAEVYNPFSVMSYASMGFVPRDYWANTGGDRALRWMLRRVDMRMAGPFTNILNGSSEIYRIRESMTYDDLLLASAEDVVSLMVMSGYLKAVPVGDGMYRVSLPNREVLGSIESLLYKQVVSNEPFSMFNTAVLDGNPDGMASALQSILCDASYFDLRDEASYELLLLTIMHGMLGGYRVASQRESGNGRVDLILEPRSGDAAPIIMELKVSDSEDDLPADAEAGLRQIHERKYYLGMKGTVILVGISFWGKVPYAKTEVLEL